MNTINSHFQQKTERLADAFRIFNELSENLANSYQGLQRQVANLSRELAEARSERIATLIEKEHLASRLQLILAALPAAVIVLNARGQIIDCNNHAISFLGEPLLGLQWQAVMARSLEAAPESPHEYRLSNGRKVSISRNPLSNDGEQLILLSDVSELRDLQDTLAQQKHLTAMGEMVASLAHQVRTPLATAILYASQMNRPALVETKRQQFSEKILERLHYLERQVNDMLIFAKQGRLAMHGFSWAQLLDRIIDVMGEHDEVRFALNEQISDMAFLGNQDALRGALLNLLNNAVEAGARTVCMTIIQQEQLFRIEISDDGPGIADQQKLKIFEPFFTTKMNGTGLGLAVVESVVKAHNGSIFCDSKPGQGTRFIICLPCQQSYCLNLSANSADTRIQENQYEAV